MFIKNKLGTFLNFTLAGKGISLPPAGVVVISDEQAEDEYLQVMINRDFVSVVGETQMDEQREKEAVKKEEEKREKPPIKRHSDQVVDGTVVVKCAGVYKNGKRCSVNVNVPRDEFDSDKPYFCKRHAGESPEDYERVDGDWVKKHKPAAKTKKRTSSKKK